MKPKKYKNKREQKLKTILYNALVLLIDETFEQYDDENEWFAMIQNELGCTAEELKEYGIRITADGGIREIIE